MTNPTQMKMRRNRKLDGEGSIRSKLPSSADPTSRVVVAEPDSNVSEAVLDLRAGGDEPLGLQTLRDRVVCGDSAKVLRRFPEGCVACAITSPPYWHLVDYGYDGQIGQGSYEEYRAGLIEVWKGVARALRPNGKFCLNVPLLPLTKAFSEEHFGKTHTRVLVDLYADLKADILAQTDLQFYGLYIWEKQTTEKMFGSYPYPPNLLERNYIEFIAVFVKPGAPPKFPPEAKEAARLTQAEWMELTKQIWWIYPDNIKRAEGHPAPFPEALPNRLINMYTFPAVEEIGFEGDLVLDPFAGWATTCVAAKRCGRRYVGIDLSPTFCTEAAQRLRDVQLEPTVMNAVKPSELNARGQAEEAQTNQRGPKLKRLRETVSAPSGQGEFF